ncbi:MAG: DUF6763 family protein [Gammaproteobacteria bacterium]
MAENMTNGIEIGQWYSDREGGLFKVVAIEAEGGVVEVQHYDGTLAELDPRDWRERRPWAAEPPENWSGAVDISGEDFRTSNDEESDSNWENPLDQPDRLGE